MQDVGVEDEEGTELEAVFGAEGQKMWRALLGFTGNPELASDALAEAFAQALARGSELRSPSKWVWRAGFRIAAGELKHRPAPLLAPPETHEDSPDTAQDVIAALRRISPNQRAAVLLHDYAGYKSREVASILGMSPATARVHLSQGRRRLRKLLEAYR
jgi:RNA polymerase sigma-70 factor (ECF subfamily)